MFVFLICDDWRQVQKYERNNVDIGAISDCLSFSCFVFLFCCAISFITCTSFVGIHLQIIFKYSLFFLFLFCPCRIYHKFFYLKNSSKSFLLMSAFFSFYSFRTFLFYSQCLLFSYPSIFILDCVFFFVFSLSVSSQNEACSYFVLVPFSFYYIYIFLMLLLSLSSIMSIYILSWFLFLSFLFLLFSLYSLYFCFALYIAFSLFNMIVLPNAVFSDQLSVPHTSHYSQGEIVFGPKTISP